MGIRAVVVVASFTVVMAGPNLPTPLLPGYRVALGLGPFGMTVLFSVYLVALVAVLLSVGVLARRCSPRALLLAGLLAGVASDAFLGCSPTLVGVLAGRVLSGLAVGSCTGAVAVLLARHGTARSGSATALCALLGSAAGTALTAVLAEYLPWPTALTYLVHAGMSLACVAAVLAMAELARPRRADTGRGEGGAVVVAGGLARFAVASGSGVCAWVTAGLIVALVPSYAAALLGARNLVVASSPVVVFLLAAYLASMLAGRWPAAVELAAAPLVMAAGLVLTASSGPLRSTVLLLVGAAFTGVGQGLGFRGGLAAALTVATPGRHGAATSRFSALAYLGAAITTLGMGLLSGAFGLDQAFRGAAVVFGVAALVLAVLGRRLFGQDGAARPATGPAARSVAGAVTDSVTGAVTESAAGSVAGAAVSPATPATPPAATR